MPVAGPYLTATQIEQVWIGAGGHQVYAQEAAAVALAESGGGTRSYNVNANGTTDYGLWQINSSNGGSSADFQPPYGAPDAIRLSENGSSWTAWCTAYTDAACGTKGGVYAPTGDSPMGRWLRSLRAGATRPIGSTTIGRNLVATAGDASVSTGADTHLPESFRRLVHALGATVPTRAKLVDRISRNFTKAVR